MQSSSALAKAKDWAKRGSAAVDAGDLETAKRCLSRAVELDRGNAERRFHLAVVLEALEDCAGAAEQLTEALRIEPSLARAARRLSTLLSRSILPGNARLNLVGLRVALHHEAVSRDAVADAALRYLASRDPLRGALAHGRAKGWEMAARQLCLKRSGPLLSDELFLDLLRTGITKSPELEALLIALRRTLLLEVPRERLADRELIRFVVVLMQQCWANEYVWMASAEELAAIGVQQVVLGKLLDGDIEAGQNLLLASLYGPTYRMFTSGTTLESIANIHPTALAEVLALRVEEHIDEINRMARIPRIVEITDETSRKVAAQYERAPYPRWTRLGMSLREGEFRKTLGDYFKPALLAFMDRPFEVLVAGCGTGMDALQIALACGQTARVTAIDLSLSSLAYASRMADRLEIRNVEFKQADILEIARVPEFHSRFRLIECGGVLHHMADPFLGWRTLLNCLAPSGIMHIALYSSIARRNLTALRSDPGYPGAGCEDAQLRAFRHRLITRPDGEPGTELKGSADFYSASGFRDLTLHVSEQCHSIPEIAEFLEETRLVFRGFQPPLFFDVLRGHHPAETWPGTLERWTELELAIPFLFVGMYKFWCERA
jgi:2-polyprenyl-3-methyl-5-hydroxy-6-metoxy-1,4-benzoquinol methylase